MMDGKHNGESFRCPPLPTRQPIALTVLDHLTFSFSFSKYALSRFPLSTLPSFEFGVDKMLPRLF
jgi:hypothetical protein